MASKGKKAVSQEELRRLMKEKQRAAERQRRVQSPFAKYTSAGRLMCTLCGEQVKSEAVWQAHVLGRGHKEKVGRLKEGQGQEQEQEQGLKRKKEEEEQQGAGKRAKEERKKEEEGAGKEAKSQKGLPAGFFQTKGVAGLGLLAGQYGEDDDDDEDEEEEEKEQKGKSDTVNAGLKPPGGAAGLPADFFESAAPGGTPSKTTGEEEEKVEEKEEEEGEGKGAKPELQLPEGFFDDPVRDARVRNVDTPREQMDREWEEFQKEMRLVNSASDAIVAEDDEEGRIERQIDEIDEQIECFRRVELLRAKQEAAQVKTAKQRAAAEEEGREAAENDEEDEEELLHVLSRDWRAKGALA
ncbi:zinc finger protein 830 [Colossoma macropomum]|uniref:zinc finger protein 830 n=1 Tax=Colossoma macropomum TaxID=42526 RepID=UPI0018652F14|nr:zinc finger protein 830 [Colossoma macropomum]